MVRSEGSPLKDRVQQMVVATNESTRLPQDWQWSGAKHRRYTQEEIERSEVEPSNKVKVGVSKGLCNDRIFLWLYIYLQDLASVEVCRGTCMSLENRK